MADSVAEPASALPAVEQPPESAASDEAEVVIQPEERLDGLWAVKDSNLQP
jgi:hypothetical protein